MEERWLYAADVLERTLEEDQHRGVQHLVFIVGVSLTVEAAHVPAELLHPVQYVTAASDGEGTELLTARQWEGERQALGGTLHSPGTCRCLGM